MVTKGTSVRSMRWWSWPGAVMVAGCAQQAAWKAQGLPTVPVALNVSPQQLRECELPTRLGGWLQFFQGLGELALFVGAHALCGARPGRVGEQCGAQAGGGDPARHACDA